MKRLRLPNSWGFTLVELLLVMAIISIIATVGIVNVVEYNRVQTFNAATNDFYSAIQLAKQRSQAQVVPSGCPLTGYRVIFNNDGTYGVTAMCNNAAQAISQWKHMPSGYTFNPASGTITFAVLSGTVQEANGSFEQIKLSGSSQTKTFNIYNDGHIVVQ